jgi:Domain of unknown function (DUF4185)
MRTFFIMLGLAVVVSGCCSVSSTGQGRGFEIVQTNFLGTLWNESQAKAKIISQDGGESFAVPGGAIWAFGDTFKGTRSADGVPHFEGGAVSCAIAFLGQYARRYPPALDYLVASNVVVSPFSYFTNEPPRDYRIWPGGGIYVNGQYYLFYSVINVFGSGTWDFRSVGSGLGRSRMPLGAYERLRPHGDWHYPFEVSDILPADGWLYLYGVAELKGKQGAELARVRPNKIEDPDAYEFYAGPGPQFSSHKEDARILIENVPGQVSVAWNAYLHKYVMASSSDFYLPWRIRFLAADAPYGPWSRPVASIEVPEVRQGKHVDLAYCAYLHPELFQNGGEVMNLTYSLSLKDGGFDCNCEMVEVKLKRK